MYVLLGRKSQTLLGVDINSTAVKLVELSCHKGQYRIENYACRPLPDGAVVESSIHDIDAVGHSIALAVAALQPIRKDAAVAVAGSAVITKTIALAADLSDAEMESQIIVEAEQYIPYPLSDVAIDFERQASNAADAGRVDVLLTACRKENVESRVLALEAGGLKARVADVETYAMERAFTLLEAPLSARTVAIVDIGATVLTLYILAHGKTIYSREQMLGGRDLAEGVLAPFKDAAVQQVNRALQLFFSSSQYNDIDQIVLAGATAALDGLADLVGGQLARPSVVANPFRNVALGSRVNKSALRADAPALMLACGLAMRSKY